MTTTERPGYLSGAMAPVPDEIDAADLRVTGTLPSELSGRYFRNGSNPLPGTDPGHNFTGQGMLHGVRIRDGRAQWYRNRWVHTPLMDGKPFDRSDPASGHLHNTSNTSVIHHGGKILSLVENGFPWEISEELESVGPWDFHGKLKTAMTAHPKLDPATGDLYIFGVSPRPPFVTFHHIDATGELLRSVPITVPGYTMMHDFAITPNYVLWLDLPVVFDRELTVRPGMPFRWSDTYGARIGVMPRGGGDADVKWIEVEPGYAFHVANARETASGKLVLDAVQYDPASFNRIWADLGGTSTLREALTTAVGGGRLHRWIVDVATGTATEERLDDLAIEFPTINENRIGEGSESVYAVSAPLLIGDRLQPSIIKYDTKNGGRSTYTFEHGWVPGEAEFVPALGGTREDDGWLISIVSHETRNAANLVVLDAGDVAAGPVATVELPRRVPLGFHGEWIPDGDGNS
ncbi:carotenoid oxygenase family protein [Amycolatopsis pithecellobii]|uniref:Dioxygenase n=1 Tax=Amycolatopsis pithecellobii TaxID=664692 RepID=A0A6N7YX00_9PSEU|nr:carotenoid oxygenase family protein [Amycolatopsis pithecellobii]MTD57617.1 dioxygenase [Amycolatopsis pithecellobii]